MKTEVMQYFLIQFLFFICTHYYRIKVFVITDCERDVKVLGKIRQEKKLQEKKIKHMII